MTTTTTATKNRTHTESQFKIMRRINSSNKKNAVGHHKTCYKMNERSEKKTGEHFYKHLCFLEFFWNRSHLKTLHHFENVMLWQGLLRFPSTHIFSLFWSIWYKRGAGSKDN